MKKIAFLLLVLSLTRVAVAYAETNTVTNPTTSNQQNYFFGNSAQATANLNQVLALLVGPRGVPGPAGVAGKDGFVGLNGENGKDGLPGAPGAVGPQGPAGLNGKDGVNGTNGTNGINGSQGPAGPPGPGSNAAYAVIPIAVGDATACNSLGGLKYVPTSGVETLVCNYGVGTGTGNLLNIQNGYASGAMSGTSCQGTNPIGISLSRHFDGSLFVFGDIAVSNVSDSATAQNAHGCLHKHLNFYFKINTDNTVPLDDSTDYTWGRVVKCSFEITGTSFTASASDTGACTTSTDANGSSYGSSTFAMGNISTADYINKIGFEIV